jgi:transposase
MAGKPKPMSQIKQVLQHYKRGVKIKAIARIVGISKNTIKAYLLKINLSNWHIDDLLSLEDPVLEARFHPGNPAYSDNRFEQLKDKLDYYAQELKRKHVTKELLWEEYRKENPHGYGRSQFCFHLLQHIRAQKPSMLLEHKPGDKLYFDFAGQYAQYIDPTTGEIVKCPLFIACLPYSGYSFIMAIERQSTEDFIYALQCAILFFGGVPLALVPDNFKGAIIKANRYEPHINRILEDFCNHYQTTVIPARVGKPRDKALVENRVHLTYIHVLAPLRNQQFFSLSDLNAALQEKNHRVNQTRMQKKPYSREEKFLAEEKSQLNPLPADAFQIKHYKTYTVSKNNFIILGEDNHYYSVPYIYMEQKVNVIYTRSVVQIYCKGTMIACHQRDRTKGGYTYLKEHLCSHHQHYLDRSPDYYIGKASKLSAPLEQLFIRIFNQDKHPEQLYRTCDGLLSIYRKTNDKEKFEKACELAMEYGKYSYQFIVNIIQNNSFFPASSPPEKPLPTHYNIRCKNYYQQLTLKPQ